MFGRILTVFFIVIPCLAFGAVEKSNEHAFVKLSHFQTSKGEEFGLHIFPKDGWYIHSSQPGEFGMPASVKWNEEKTKVFNEKWSEGEDIDYQGFALNVFKKSGLYSAIIEPANYAQKLNLEVSFMACKDECFPEKMNFEFFLKDVEKSTLQKLKESKFKDIFAKLHFKALLFAFLGGLILNIMPCVFPVLFIKIIGLTKVINRRESIRDSILYLLGVVLCFLIMGIFLLFLKSRGQAIGWGFQLQSPIFLAIMIAVFFILGLMFLDVININLPINKIPAGSFFTGLLAVLIASPCSAPFMGAAIGWSLTSKISNIAFCGVFLALGLGYALPFFVAGFFPRLIIKIMPRPGKWMIWIKKVFAIPMFLTCLWLLWILFGNSAVDTHWQNYDEKKIQILTENNEKIFIDFSAKWCITCLANEKAVLNNKKFYDLVSERNIHLFKADWTEYDANITKALAKFGRASVPLYIFFDGNDFIVLPQIVTFETLLRHFDNITFR